MNRQQRRLLLIFTLMLLFFFGVSMLRHPDVPVRAAPSGFNYYQEFTLTASGTTLTNYSIRFTVYYGSGTSSGTTIYCNSHCETDFDDVRFYTTGDVEIDQWVEFTNSTLEHVWVEFPTISTSGTDYRVWYGYGPMSDPSDGAATFPEYFDSTSTSGWTTDNMAVSAESGYLRFYNPTASTVGYAVRYDISVPDKYVLMYRFKEVAQGTDQIIVMTLDGSTSHRWSMLLHPKSDAQTSVYYYEGAYRFLYGSYVEGTEYIATHKVDEGDSSTGMDYGFYGTDWTQLAFDDDEADALGSPSDTDGLWIGDGTSAALCDARFLWIIFRPYADTDPSSSDWSGETALNTAPSADGAGISNPDDTDNLYARYRTYYFYANTSDVDGYADIETVTLQLGVGGEQQWRVEYDEDTNTFSEAYGASYIELVTGSSSAARSGNDCDVTFAVIIEWAHSGVTNYDVYITVTDDDAATDNYTADIDLDVISTVDGTFTLNDGLGITDRGNIDGGITAYGTIYYYGSGGDNYPASDAVDVWVFCTSVATSPWSDTTLVDGAYSLSVYADDVVGLDTYYVHVVVESAGSGGTNLYYNGDNLDDTYIADRIFCTSILSTDDRINVDATATINIYLIYDYDNTALTDGTVQVNSVSASYITGSQWRFTDSKSSVQAVTYNALSASGNYYGVTATTMNGLSEVQIWDKVLVTLSNTAYWKLPLGVNASCAGSYVTLSAIFDYDDTPFNGVVTLNDTNFAHSSAGYYGYTTASISGGSHGITVYSSNSITILWQTVDESWSHFWSQYEANAFVHIDVTGISWGTEGTYVPATSLITIKYNGTAPYSDNPTNGQVTGIVKLFDASWKVCTFTVWINYTTAPYYFLNYQIHEVTDDVPTWHTLYIEVFSMEIDDYYINIYWESNWHNSTCFIFKDGVYQSNVTSEGFAQIGKPTTGGSYVYVFIFNATGGATSGDQNPALGDSDWWCLRTRNVDISVTAHIVLLDGWGMVIDQQRFQIYVDNALLNPYEPFYVCTSATGNITIYDEYWDKIVYTNATYSMTARITITLDCHWLIIVNQNSFSVCANVTYNSVTHSFRAIADRAMILIFDGSYGIRVYRERDNHQLAYIANSGEYISGNDAVTIDSDYIVIVRELVGAPESPPNFEPLVMLIALIGVVVFFVFVAVAVMALRGRRGQKRLEQGVFSPPDGVSARPLGTGRPSKTKRDTRDAHEREWDSHAEEWDRIKREAT